MARSRQKVKSPSLVIDSSEKVEEVLAWPSKLPNEVVIGKDKQGNSVTVTGYLGGGESGQVFLGKWGAQTVAIKQINVKAATLEKARGEIKTLKKLDKKDVPYVVQCYLSNRVSSSEYYYVVMEYMNKGSLSDLIKSGYPRQLDVIHSILVDCVSGIKGMHAHNMLHQDIKDDNLVVHESSDGSLIAKLCDFGFSYEVKLDERVWGTPCWMAPEVLSCESENSEASDMYSFGMMVLKAVTWTNTRLYSDIKTRIKLEAIVTNPKNEETRQPIPVDMPANEREVMIKCWRHDPGNRPSASRALSMLLFKPDEVKLNESKKPDTSVSSHFKK